MLKGKHYMNTIWAPYERYMNTIWTLYGHYMSTIEHLQNVEGQAYVPKVGRQVALAPVLDEALLR